MNKAKNDPLGEYFVTRTVRRGEVEDIQRLINLICEEEKHHPNFIETLTSDFEKHEKHFDEGLARLEKIRSNKSKNDDIRLASHLLGMLIWESKSSHALFRILFSESQMWKMITMTYLDSEINRVKLSKKSFPKAKNEFNKFKKDWIEYLEYLKEGVDKAKENLANSEASRPEGLKNVYR